MFERSDYLEGLTEAHSVIVKLFHGGFPGAVVGGGFFRDLTLGVPPKDLDVFIPFQTGDELKTRLSAALNVPLKFMTDLSYGEDSEIARIFSEVEDGWVHSAPIQVIEMAEGVDPSERAAHHDFGLVQVWMGMDGYLRHTTGFAADMAGKTCTLIDCDTEKEHTRSMKRWERWSKGRLGEMGFRLVDTTFWAAGRRHEAFLG